jgi:hypothetical protein
MHPAVRTLFRAFGMVRGEDQSESISGATSVIQTNQVVATQKPITHELTSNNKQYGSHIPRIPATTMQA